MQVDAIVIGGGQAGVPLAGRLAASGRKVLLVERARMGGTCVNYGCTPTKTLVASARAAHVARSAGRLGVHAEAVRVDFPAIMGRKDAIVRQWRDGLDRRLASAGDRLRVLSGHARFVADREIEVSGERYRAEVIVVNVGVRPVPPSIEGVGSLPWLDNHRILELSELPAHLVVLGGGYIGCEFAQMFRRFGSAITVVQRGPHLLDREDPDVSQELEAVFRAEGIELLLGARVARAVAGPAGAVGVELEGGRQIVGSHLLAAVGRRPNTDDLGCEAGASGSTRRASSPSTTSTGPARPACTRWATSPEARSSRTRRGTIIASCSTSWRDVPPAGAPAASSRTRCSRIRR
jgi:pyruvate/2-oxoglutarate dehydrogenase complex dihydrolipoamide dehydrogenase (E3) component